MKGLFLSFHLVHQLCQSVQNYGQGRHSKPDKNHFYYALFGGRGIATLQTDSELLRTVTATPTTNSNCDHKLFLAHQAEASSPLLVVKPFLSYSLFVIWWLHPNLLSGTSPENDEFAREQRLFISYYPLPSLLLIDYSINLFSTKHSTSNL